MSYLITVERREDHVRELVIRRCDRVWIPASDEGGGARHVYSNTRIGSLEFSTEHSFGTLALSNGNVFDVVHNLDAARITSVYSAGNFQINSYPAGDCIHVHSDLRWVMFGRNFLQIG